MDAFASFDFQSPSRNHWTYDSLRNFRQISPVVQTHLKRVYLTLCCALVASAVGAYLHILWNVGGLLTALAALAALGGMAWLHYAPPYEEQKRVAFFIAATVFEGASFAHLINQAIEIDPSILTTAFVGTSLAFGCFSAAAMLSKRREYLYLDGLLSSSLSIRFWLLFASFIFEGSAAILKLELYIGLLAFVGHVAVGTQNIIEKAYNGDLDYVKHACDLFIDFLDIFVRILVIMLRSAEKK